MVLSKSTIEGIAKQIVAPILVRKSENENKLKTTLFDIVHARIKKDKDWFAVYRAYEVAPGDLKNLFAARDGLYLYANGFNRQYVRAAKGSYFLFSHDSINLTDDEAAKLKPIMDKIEALQEQYDQTRRELIAAFASLKTDKRITEAFPEVLKYMPERVSTCVALVPNLDALREKINSL